MRASDKYEKFVADLTALLLRDRRASEVSHGRHNYLPGAAVLHQIDVSFVDGVTDPSKIVLIECKCLKRTVTLAHVKVLKATVDDIATGPALGRPVHGLIVSLKRLQPAAVAYAGYYGIQAQCVADGPEYDFSYDELRLVARTGVSFAVGYASAEGYAVRNCIRCGEWFRAAANLELCEACNSSHCGVD